MPRTPRPRVTPCATRGLLLLGLVSLTVLPSAFGQAPSFDKVTYRNADGKVVTDAGELKEFPGRVELLTNGKTKAILAPDILKVEPGSLAGVSAVETMTARGLEDNKDLGKPLAAYGDLVKKAGAAAPERTRRFLASREANFAAKLADGKTGAEFDAEARRAVEKLSAVTALSRKSWEVWPAAKLTARLQAELGDFAKAAATLGSLAATPDLPKELRLEARLLEAGMSLRAAQWPALDGALDLLEKDKDLVAGPQRERLDVLKVAAALRLPATPPGGPPPPENVARLQAAIDLAKSPVAKGIGYTALAELQLAHNQAREAMWAYLWVDVVYNQEHDDQVLAVRRLAQIFDLLGDKDRAEQFREKLTRVR